ncbi:MAG TPA: hypothetical protein VG733_05520 [Chthoniobacteraceae bacterium]|nr:hypothetical protein [Chthoniobacteraceae bacterium]
MKTISRFAIIACVLALFPLGLHADDLTATIKKEAQNCANAVVANNLDGIVKYTHPRVIKSLGGEAAMVAALKDGVAEMQASGTGFISATIGTPQAPKKIGSWITSIVPEHIVMKVEGGKLLRDSYLLAISEDGGHHWVFFDIGQTTKEHFAEVFPELAGQVPLPAMKKPVFQENK